MTYNEEYILSLIKDLKQEVSSISSVVGYLASHSGGGGGGGCTPGIWRAAPTSPEPPPPNVACDGQFLRFYDGSATLYWDAAHSVWR